MTEVMDLIGLEPRPGIRGEPCHLHPEPPLCDSGSLSERAVLLRLAISAWGVDRRLKDHQYEVDANKSMIRAGKKLLVSPELAAIHSLDGSCRDWVGSRSLPSQFKSGVYLQPIANIVEVDEYIVAYASRRAGLVEQFLRAYPQRTAEARLELRSLYDPKNYPPADALRHRFGVRHEYLEISSAPGSLRAVSSALFRREQEKAHRRFEELLDEARQVLREQMAGLVDHMVDRLQPGENGKPRIFRDTLVTQMEDWLSTFCPRNLADDSELAELVDQARRLLRPEPSTSLTAETLRTDTGLRMTLQQQFANIKERLDPLVIDRPGRRIRLED